jgi:hypothetical protein
MRRRSAAWGHLRWPGPFFFCVLALCLSACNDEQSEFPPDGAELRLEPGSSVTGVDGVVVHAPAGALEQAIWVTISRVERPDGRPLPVELELAGPTYHIRTRDEMRFDRVPLVFELPLVEARPQEELAGAFLSRAAWRAGLEDTFTHDEDIWTPIDGRASADRQRLELDVWAMPDEGHTVALAHGRYFTHWTPEQIDALEDTLGREPSVRRQGLDDVDFYIICEGNAEAFCNDIVAHVRNLLREVHSDFRGHGYKEPRLKTKWLYSGTVYKFYLRRVEIGDGDDLCHFSSAKDQWGGPRGFYNAVFAKATVCVFDTERRGIRLFPGNFLPGERLHIEVGSNRYDYVVATGIGGLDALAQLGETLRVDPTVEATVIDGMLSVRPRGHRRLENLEAGYQGGGYLWWNRFDHYARFTLRHEYYHALQYSYGPTYRSLKQNTMMLEGTAVAAERSGDQMIRNPLRPLRVVDEPLYFDTWSANMHDYAAQDFFVFLGRRINASVAYLIPLWQRGGWLSDLEDFLRQDYSPGESFSLATAYWEWAKNQAIEKRVDIGHDFFGSAQRCTLRTNTDRVMFPTLSTSGALDPTASRPGTVTAIQARDDGTSVIVTTSGTYELPYPLEPGVGVGDSLAAGERLAQRWQFIPDKLVHRRLFDGAALTVDRTFGPLDTRVAEFVFGPYDGNREVELQALSRGTSLRTAFYDEREAGTSACHGRLATSEHRLVIPRGETRRIWIVAANTSSEESQTVSFSARFVDPGAPTVEITAPALGSTLLEARPFVAAARIGLSTSSATLRWYLGDELVWQGTVASNQTFFVEPFDKACPVGAGQRLRVVLEDERGLWADDEVSVEVNALGAQQRLAIEAAIGNTAPALLRASVLHVAMVPGGSGWRVPDIALQAELEQRQCITFDDLDATQFQWRRDGNGELVTTGVALRVEDSFFEVVNAVHQAAIVSVHHPRWPQLSNRVTLVPCNPYGLNLQGPTPPFLHGYPACPTVGFGEQLSARLFNAGYDVFINRRETDAAIFLQNQLDAIFNGSVPAFFPGDASGIAESMAHGRLAPMIYYLRWDLANAHTLGEARAVIRNRELQASIMMDDEKDALSFFLHATALLDVHLDFFSAAEVGGLDGWWLLEDTVTGTAISEAAITRVATVALDGFMTGFSYENPSHDINRATAVERGTQAAIVGSLMYASTLLP